MRDIQAEYFEGSQPMSDWEDFEEDDFEEDEFDTPGTGYPSDAFDLAEMVLDFIERTPELTELEQAQLLGAFAKDTMRSGEVDWGRVAQGVQTGLSLFQTGAQIAGGIAGAVGGNNRTARDIALWSRQLGQGAGIAQNLLGSIRPGQMPPRRPAGIQPGAQPGGPYRRYPTPPAAPTGRQAPVHHRTVAPAGAPGRLPLNNAAQFASLLNNPQIMQALRSALFRGREGALRVEADFSNSAPVDIPMSDVMATFARLAQEAAFELSALSDQDTAEIPGYLISENGEFLVDPECPEERGALVLEYLRHWGMSNRYDEPGGFVKFEEGSENEMDPSEVWAREAGFDG